MSAVEILAACTLFAWAVMAAVAVYSSRRVIRLEDAEEARPEDPPLPTLSVVVAARNEERSVEDALGSLLSLDYPEYEVVFVDDRSEDRTGEIADRLSAGDDRLKVVHVRELPAGWFGKNHASHRGAQAASGEILLFTDGDILFDPDAVARGVRHLVRNRLDHLSAAPALTVRGFLLQACVVALHWGIDVTRRLWKVRDPESSEFFGVGSYNLFRADSYLAIGGHRQVALRPDEDLQLGRLVKLSGKRSDFLRAESSVRCEWYRSVRELIRGMEKNAFAAWDYRIAAVVGGTVVLLWVAMAPLVLGLLLAPVHGTAAAMFLASAVIACGIGILIARESSFPWWTGLALPVGILVIAHIWWRSAILTILRGVAWGGAPVPLSELRAARVRPVDGVDGARRVLR